MNLWACGAALQCCVSEEKIDLLIPVYHCFVNPDSIFDPSLLSLTVVQVKFKTGRDLDAELAISPFGVVHNLDKPLPYLVIVMELGCEWHYEGNIKFLASEPPTDYYSLSQPLFQSQLLCFMRIPCFIACGDSPDHPWKCLMLCAWDVLHLVNPVPYYIS